MAYKPEVETVKVYTSEEKADASVTKESVIVQQHCWTKMHGWCKAAKSEVSGLGLARLTEHGIEVYEAFILKQQCSSSYTELDDGAVARLNLKLHKKKKHPEDIRFWWHTHYNFSVFWSGTDDDNARRMVEMNGDWLLSIVINQAGNYRCRIDTVRPVKATIDNVKVYLSKSEKKHERKRNYKSDIKRWVSPIKFTAPDKGVVRPDHWKGYEGAPSRHWSNAGDYEEYGGDYRGWEQFGEAINTVHGPGKGSEDRKEEPREAGLVPFDHKNPVNGDKRINPKDGLVERYWVGKWSVAPWFMQTKKSSGVVVPPPIPPIAKPVPKISEKYQVEDGEEIILDGVTWVCFNGKVMTKDQFDYMVETGHEPGDMDFPEFQ